MNERQGNLVEIVKDKEFVLIDTNFIKVSAVADKEFTEKYRDMHDPLLKSILNHGQRGIIFKLFSVGDIKRINEAYRFFCELIKENKNIFTIRGVISEIMPIFTTYSYVSSKIHDKEDRRENGEKSSENKEKSRIIKGITREVKSIITSLEKRVLPEDDTRYELFKKYASTLNGKKDEVDEALVAMAFYQLVYHRKEVAVFSSDIGVKSKSLGVKGLIERMYYMLRGRDYEFLFNGWNDKRKLTLCNWLTKDGSYQEYRTLLLP